MKQDSIGSMPKNIRKFGHMNVEEMGINVDCPTHPEPNES